MFKNELDQYKELVQMLCGQFGDSCDSILYALEGTNPLQGSAVAVSGTTTGIRLGDSLPSFLLEYMQTYGYKNAYGFINKALPGLVLRTSILFLFSATQEAIGCLCIHHNIVHIKMITSFLEELTRPTNLEDEYEQEVGKVPGEKSFSSSDIQGFLNSIISEFIVERMGDNSFASLKKGDKLALMAELDQRGVFLVKGAVNLVAKRMNVSKFSIYNYLDEIRTNHPLEQ